MSEETCVYHPSRAANTKCERCNRLICLSDTQKVKSRRSSGTSEHRSYYMVEYTFCPVCKLEYAEDAKESVNKGGSIILIFLIGSIGIMFAFILWSNNQWNEFTSDFPMDTGPSPLEVALPFLGVFTLIAVGMIFVTTRFGKKAADKEISSSKQLLNQFLETVENSEFIKNYDSSKDLTCNQCYSRIPADSAFCMSCGDSTKDERAQL